MSNGKYLFTSESVSMGHPDKLADRISDAVLDAIFEQDPHSRVACETLVTTGLAMIAGEISTKANVNSAKVNRDTIREVGYTDDLMGICADTCNVMVALDAVLNDPRKGKQKDFLTRHWGDAFTENAAIPAGEGAEVNAKHFER